MEKYTENCKTIVRYNTDEAAQLPSLTDWGRIDSMNDETLTASALSDPDALPVFEDDTSSGRVRELKLPEIDGMSFAEKVRLAQKANKKLVSVRYDEDIIVWYKKQGKGYQSLMNNVLRAYMESRV